MRLVLPLVASLLIVHSAENSRRVMASDPAPEVRLRYNSAAAPLGVEFSVTADAYVLIVAVLPDESVEVLFPALPVDSAHVEKGRYVRLPHLPREFARDSFPHLAGTTGEPRRVRGIHVEAVASALPLHFQELTRADGTWDRAAVKKIAAGGTSVLGHAVVAKGQAFQAKGWSR